MNSSPNRPLSQVLTDLQRAVGTVVIGQQRPTEQIFVAILCSGHILIEDVPGVGKTLLAKAIARALGNLPFQRVQGVPDRLPSEITGSTVFNPRNGEFHFVPGPIISSVVLFDELNRSPTKTQAALLEAMEEGQVTIDGVTHALPKPFFVIATQNPIEFEGTFPLSEAQLDRFQFIVRLDYPSQQEADQLLQSWSPQGYALDRPDRLDQVRPVLNGANDIIALRNQVQAVRVERDVRSYLAALTQATRDHGSIRLGLSPRGMLVLQQASKAFALLANRDYVVPDDVQLSWLPTAQHRVLLYPDATFKGVTSTKILAEILEQVPVPGSPVAAVSEQGRR